MTRTNTLIIYVCLLLLGLSRTMEIYAGDTFYAQTQEGITLRFGVLDEQEKTAEVSAVDINTPAMDSAVKGKVTIPSEVNGYKVTRIGDAAFSDCSMDSVIISEGVESIGKFAFSGCGNISYVSIPSTIKTLERFAFAIGPSLRSFVSYIENPQGVINEDVFDEQISVDSKQRRIPDYEPSWSIGTYEDATLYVPKGSIKLYQEDRFWGFFSNIKEQNPYDLDGDGTLTLNDITTLINIYLEKSE